jgi:hypothetical protein
MGSPMTDGNPLPRRMIHLDFHTAPSIPDVGRDFDPETFARAFADAEADSVCVFAKCHHGMLYFDTRRPERHPGLPPGLDLLGAEIDALHRRGIRAPVYLSVQCDERAADEHPDWAALDPEGRPLVMPGPNGAGWRVLDMSSPYQDYLADQLREVLDRFAPVDGLFFDMCWDQPSASPHAARAMEARGLDPRSARDRAAHARAVAHGYMRRFRGMVDQACRGHAPAWVWFNSRPKVGLDQERELLNHLNVECLPTGGWGYAYYPYVSRYVRPLGLPSVSHTGRFHRSWGDFGGLKPEAALRYECCQMMSQGMGVGVGDQLHPRGTLDQPAYRMIGRVFGYVRSCEPWTAGGRILGDVAVIVDPARGDAPGPAGLGITRCLQELRQQFDLLPPSADLGEYALVIVPEMGPMDPALARRLEVRLAAGGAVLVCGAAALDAAGAPALTGLGISCEGASPFSVAYFTPGELASESLPPMAHAIYERTLRMRPTADARALCPVVEPYFEREPGRFSSHAQTPPNAVSPYAAAIQRGNAITVAFPVFEAYGRHGSLACRELLRACIDRLLPRPLLRAGGPACLETSVVRMDGWTTVHLVSFPPIRKTADLDVVEDPLPLVDVPLSLRLPRPPSRVFTAPALRELPFEWRDGRAETRVTCLDGHVMVVFQDGA